MDEAKTSANGNGSQAKSNGNGTFEELAERTNGNGSQDVESIPNSRVEVATLLADTKKPDARLDADGHEIMDACDAGNLMFCAETQTVDEGEEPPVVVAEAPGGKWNRFKTYSVLQRTLEIWKFAFTFLFKNWLLGRKWSYGKEGMTPERISARKTELAIWLRNGLLRLGPTFIKIGQQFSTRVDLLSKEYLVELEKLQDNVPPFSSQAAMQIIEEDFGCKIAEKFTYFDPVPIAAASLGQVHKARIGNKQVVVKVQRPGLKSLFDIDLKNIRVLAEWLQKVDPKTDGAARDWVAIYDECARILYEEIDYEKEGRNADEFRKNFADKDWLKVPEIYWNCTSKRVLTMEYCPGLKINKAAEIEALGLDKQRLARLTVECYLQQILTHGFFHADPHPGNVAVDKENGGRLIYYDYGMMGRIAPGIRAGLLDLFYAVYEKNADKSIDALIQMGVLVPGGDMTAVRRTGQFFLDSFQERLEAQKKEKEKLGKEYEKDFKGPRSKDESKQVRKKILSSIGEDLLAVSADQPFRFPATFTFVVRSFTVLDGIGKSLNPKFDISEIAAPYARELILEGRPKVDKLQREFQVGLERNNRSIVNLFKGPNKIEKIEEILVKLERGDFKPRVRVLDSERQLKRVAAMQALGVKALIASSLVNVGTVLSVSAMATPASIAFAAAGLMGFLTALNALKVMKIDKKERQLQGQF